MTCLYCGTATTETLGPYGLCYDAGCHEMLMLWARRRYTLPLPRKKDPQHYYRRFQEDVKQGRYPHAVCKHCRVQKKEHADYCLFAPTRFEPILAAEWAKLTPFERTCIRDDTYASDADEGGMSWKARLHVWGFAVHTQRKKPP